MKSILKFMQNDLENRELYIRMRCVANDVGNFFNYGRNLIDFHYSVEHATTINSAVHNVHIEWIISLI